MFRSIASAYEMLCDVDLAAILTEGEECSQNCYYHIHDQFIVYSR